METLLLPAVTLSAALALFVALYQLVRFETIRGERVVLGRVRGGLDWLVDAGSEILSSGIRAAVNHWQLRSDRPTTDANVVSLMRHATKTPLTVTHTDNHLSKMRDHKTDTALTPAQQRKLRHKKLEERF